jgi:flagellar protein FliO/FliZ
MMARCNVSKYSDTKLQVVMKRLSQLSTKALIAQPALVISAMISVAAAPEAYADTILIQKAKVEQFEGGLKVKVTAMGLEKSKTQRDITVRSKPEYIQVEIPNAKFKSQQELMPLSHLIFKSVLVTKDASGHGVRVKFTLHDDQKGTINPEGVEVRLNSNGYEFQISEAVTKEKVALEEAVRQVGFPLLAANSSDISGQDLGREAIGNASVKAAVALEGQETANQKSMEKNDDISEKMRLKESQILIPTVASEKKTGDSTSLRNLFLSLALVGVVLAGALYGIFRFTKAKSFLSQAPKMRVISQFHLGPRKSLTVVQIAGESILLGVTDHNISFIKNLALFDEELPATVPKNFRESLSNAGAEIDGGMDSVDEEFAFQGLGEIKDRVSEKLKGMRSI